MHDGRVEVVEERDRREHLPHEVRGVDLVEEAHLHDALEQVAALAELGDDEHVVGCLVHVDDAEQVRVLRPARPPADALQDGDLRAGGKRAA